MGDTSGNKSDLSSQLKQIGALTAIPVILVVGPVLGYFAGDWIDHRFHLTPWFTILFVMLGFGAAGREIFRLLKQLLKEDSVKNSK